MVHFNGYLINKFSLEKIDNIPEEKQKSFDLNYNCYQNEEKGKEYQYCVSIEIILYTNKSKLELILDGYFDIPEDSDDNIKQSFLNISAPAILYPYVRTFISNVTSFDIDETVILPVINFADLYNRNKKVD